MNADQTVILIEDDAALRAATVQGLELAGLAVRAFATAEAALAVVEPDLDGVIVSDIRLPRMDGLQLLAEAVARDPDLPVILVTGHGDVPMAVAALKQGAADFLTKPFAIDHLVATIRRAMGRRALVVENRRLHAALAATSSPLIGDSAVMSRLRNAVSQLAVADVDVLIEGETGSGKDLVATLLHRQGRRRARPLITIDCAALQDASAEIELFGHATDSVPHTRLSRDGQIALSDGGTLLLDGIDALSLPLQARMLRVLEEREVQPIGAERAKALDLRVIATTHRWLEEEVATNRFRADLFYRLAATRLQLPPLRERDDDCLLLFLTFAEEAKEQLGRPDFAMSDPERRHLAAHSWPGNVRELRKYAFEAVLGSGAVTADTPPDLRQRVGEFEAAAIIDALRMTNGNVVRALKRLNIPRKTLYDKFNRYGIDPEKYRH